jgi:pimeloyl-ACP methyl ester carboxylesterase
MFPALHRTARYVRLIALFILLSSFIVPPTTTRAGAQRPLINQPNAVAQTGEVLLSQGKPATASSSFGAGKLPGNANDGNLETDWEALNDSFPQYWEVDLGAAYPLTRLETDWISRFEASFCYQYTVQTRTTSSESFVTVLDRSNNRQVDETIDTLPASVTARYVRITIISGFTDCNLERPATSIGIEEATIYGSSGPITISMTDSQGQPVSALGLNAEGWPATNSATGAPANPITVTVTIANTTGNNLRSRIELDLGSSTNTTRLYVLAKPDTCGSGFVGTEFSFTTYRAACNEPQVLAPNATLTRVWRVWIQPSQAGTLDLSARIRNQDQIVGGVLALIGTATQSLSVPLARIHPIVFLPGITATLPPSYDQSQADRLLFLSDIGAGYRNLTQFLEKLGYEKNRTYFRFPYDWLQSHMKSALRLRDDVLLKQRATVANVPWAAASGNLNAVKYDLVGHSGGGLVARAYIQGPHWQGHVRRLVTVGSPHKGVTEAYTLFEGIEERDPGLALITNIFSRARCSCRICQRCRHSIILAFQSKVSVCT